MYCIRIRMYVCMQCNVMYWNGMECNAIYIYIRICAIVKIEVNCSYWGMVIKPFI